MRGSSCINVLGDREGNSGERDGFAEEPAYALLCFLLALRRQEVGEEKENTNARIGSVSSERVLF